MFEGEPLAVIDSFLNRIPSSVSSITIEPSTIIWTDYERYTTFLLRFQGTIRLFLARWQIGLPMEKPYGIFKNKNSAKEKYESMCKLHPKNN